MTKDSPRCVFVSRCVLCLRRKNKIEIMSAADVQLVYDLQKTYRGNCP